MILLYGAYGYTGTLIAERAQSLGVKLVLSGRDEVKLRPLAERTGHGCRPMGLDALDLSGIQAVIGAAGPFVHTAPAMVDACIRQHVHYIDITGEIPVFDLCAARSAEAVAAGVGLLPGAGFDIVPSDCLAKHVSQRLPGASRLKVSICVKGGSSRGTATTAIEHGAHGKVRRGGVLVDATIGSITGRCDFGDKERDTLAIPWADVATAGVSTGIPDVEVHFAMPPSVILAARIGGRFGGVLDAAWVKRALRSWLAKQPAGPDAEARERGWCRLVAEAENKEGKRVVSRLRTPEGYSLTSATALEAALRAARGELRPGWLTPSLAFGADFILGFAGCEREDVTV